MRLLSVLLVLVTLVLSNCKDRYDLKTNRTQGSLVINGGIFDSSGPQILKLGMTTEINKEPDPVTGAQVSITDENGNLEYYQPAEDGTYQLNGTTVTGRVLGTYVLDIVLPNGKHYRSSPEQIPTTKANDQAYFKVIKEDLVSSEGVAIKNTNVKIFLNTILPSQNSKSFIRWGVDEVYVIIPTCSPYALACPPFCYIYQQVSKFNLKVVSTEDYKQPALNDLLLQTRSVDYTFMVRHYFNITQYSMNKHAFDYWQKVESLTERNGSIFDTPPANIPGNINNVDDPNEIVYGFFEASAMNLTRVFVDKGYIPLEVDITNCAWDYRYWPSGTLYNYCSNPYAITGATTIPPPWFW